MTFANKITLTRLVLIPVFIIGLIQDAVSWPLAVFVFCALTDVLDGVIARRFNQKTVLGTFLDPVADKLLINATFLTLAFQDRIPGWVFVTVFSRDVLILLGWNVLYVLTRSSTVEPRWLGKSTTLVQMLAIIVHLSPLLAPGTRLSTTLVAVFTALSAIDYVWVGGKKLNQLG